MRLTIAMTGATGAPLGTALLQALKDIEGIETHLILSRWAKKTIELETKHSVRDVMAMADVTHSAADQAATISLGFISHGWHDHYSLQHENVGGNSRGLCRGAYWPSGGCHD